MRRARTHFFARALAHTMGDSFLSRLTGGWIGGGAAGAGGKTGGAHSQGYRTAGGAAFAVHEVLRVLVTA